MFCAPVCVGCGSGLTFKVCHALGLTPLVDGILTFVVMELRAERTQLPPQIIDLPDERHVLLRQQKRAKEAITQSSNGPMIIQTAGKEKKKQK